MKRRCQRRAFAAQRYVRAPEIRDRRYAGARRDDVRVADLQRKRTRSPRLVPQGLAVTADRGDLGGVDAAILEQCNCCIPKALTDPAIQFSDQVDRALSRRSRCP